jgi:hypothetical protein
MVALRETKAVKRGTKECRRQIVRAVIQLSCGVLDKKKNRGWVSNGESFLFLTPILRQKRLRISIYFTRPHFSGIIPG